jgi:hypothetical protein
VEPLAAVCRSELDGYPFRQLPRYVEEHGVDVVQSMVRCSWRRARVCASVYVRAALLPCCVRVM